MRRLLRLLSARLREWCLFDSAAAGWALARAQILASRAQFARGDELAGWQTLFRVHRAALSPAASAEIESMVFAAYSEGSLQRSLADFVSGIAPTPQTQRIFSAPASVLGPHGTVLKSYTGSERGVLLLNYSFIYAPFARLFDLDRVTERYHLVLEPSWSGSCDANVLLFGSLDCPVFVQTSEPRDMEFLRRYPGRLVPVPIAANWWIDHEIFHERSPSTRDADVAMVAAWATYKRHDRFFDALGRLRRRGTALKVLLSGYPGDLALDDIKLSAASAGVLDLVEFHEWLRPEEIAALLNRAKVSVLWSRREGFNRAVIESLFTNTPVVMREGFNYGHHYDYVNADTGRFANEDTLPDVLAEMVEESPRMSPRQWALDHMTYLHATRHLESAIARETRSDDDAWSGAIAAHVSSLHGNRYVEPGCADRFRPDYSYLASCVRS